MDFADKLKRSVFKMSATQIIASLVFISGFLILLFIYALGKISIVKNQFLVLALLTLLLLLTRLSILSKVGIGFVCTILFPVTLFFGLIPALAMIAATTYIYIKIATRPTPVDFLITKGVQSAVAQLIYFSMWVCSISLAFRFLGASYVMGHVVTVYMLSVLLYVIYMIILLPLVAKEPVPMALINGMMMMAFQFLLIKTVGPRFFQYLSMLAKGG